MTYWRRCNPQPDEPGTCLWCGTKLRKESHHHAAAYGRDLDDRNLGDYGDGFFCGLRCGFQFGKAFAEFGRRLKSS